jgi:hypothetical protein
MTEIDRWIDLHETELHELAERVGAHADTVHFLVTLVLSGSSDTDIYEHLSELIPSPDGQHSPLDGAPELLQAVRQLVATS